MNNEFEGLLRQELGALGGRQAKRMILGSMQGPRAIINDQEVIILSSTNYLGLAAHPKVITQAIETAKAWGAGSASGPRICGVTTLHRTLERALADFLGVESSLLYASAFNANIGLIPSIAKKGDIIFSDELNHASIIDGCRLSRAELKVYRHNDMKQLEGILQEAMNYRLRLIVTDGVFSMDGDVARLPDQIELARRYNAVLCVDDAHGVGVMGDDGRGTADYYGIPNSDIDILTGTLGKALGGGVGGFVAGKAILTEYLVQFSRAYRFTNTIPATAAATAIAALDIVKTAPEVRARLWENVSHFKNGIGKIGFSVVPGVSPIVAVLTYEDHLALSLCDELMRLGVFVQAYIYPVVPKGRARLRVIMTAAHSREDIECAVQAFATAGRQLKIVTE